MIYNITISMSMDKCARLIVYNLYYQVSDYLRLKAYYIQRLTQYIIRIIEQISYRYYNSNIYEISKTIKYKLS